MQRDIQKLIRDRILEAQEAVIKDAVADFEKVIRQIVGKVAINVSNYYSIERSGPNLVITVKVGEEPKP